MGKADHQWRDPLARDAQFRINADGTLDGRVLEPARRLGRSWIITVAVPVAHQSRCTAGCYYLIRCGAQTPFERTINWQIYLRRALFIARRPRIVDDMACCELTFVESADPGLLWLRTLEEEASLNLMGPFGNGVEIAPNRNNLLLISDPVRATRLLSAADRRLDLGGRVTLVLRADPDDSSVDPLVAALPIAVEVQRVSASEAWIDALADTIPWADQIVAALPITDAAALAASVRQHRFRYEEGLAFMLVDADLACGVGACLACVVPLANGSVTRACIHGPVMDLTRLAR